MIETNAAAAGNAGQCRNCEASMEPAQRFCGACGQRAVAARLTMRDIGHDLMHAITHADHSIFALLKSLVVRPGHVAREFIEGKRKKHFGPFAFLIISVGLASFATLLTGVRWFANIPDSAGAGFLQRHFNLVILVQLPILALISWGLFFRERLNYGEHLILAAFTSGLRALLLALVEVPLLYLSGQKTADPVLVWVYFVIWVAYFAFAASQFYRGNRAWTACKAVLVAVSSQIATVFVVFVYVYLFARFAH